MNKSKFCIVFWVFFTALTLDRFAMAEQHANEALRHATEAAASQGDSKAVGEHAGEALKHIEAAKATNPDLAKKLGKSEADLNSAVEHAKRYNTDSAGKDAKDAKTHIEQIR